MPLFNTDDERWKAVQQRDSQADTEFVYGVLTTGVYCYPSCPSRASLRENTRFYTSRQEAMEAGLRACKRCRSDEPPLLERQRLLVERGCRLIESSDAVIKIDSLAGQLEVSRFHLSKLFQKFLGLGPKEYAKAVRAKQVGKALETTDSVTRAVYEAGYDSASAYYANGSQRLGMTASSYRRKGQGLQIRYAFGTTQLGKIVVAATEKGVCSILFGESQKALMDDLGNRFSQATLTPVTDELQGLVQSVVAQIDNPGSGRLLPLDIQGTAFQEKVWAALRDIPVGQTCTYSDIAQQIGKPTAARAVAQACAANPAAVLVPCHRVVRASGELSGYRWGVERKRKLLEREKVEG